MEDGNFTYTYDANGNLTRKTDKATSVFAIFEYDAENKLVRVVRNGTTINYRYDGLGRRVEKEVNDGVTTKVARYIYDFGDVLLELDASNNIIARYTHGQGVDQPLILEKNSQAFFYHGDGLGTITEITNQSGSVVQSYTYSSFGRIESQLDPAFVQPFTFTSREFDPETGLYFYRSRYYDPTVGRFLAEDIFSGIAKNPQTQNKYPYVGNQPLNFVDPSGNFPLVNLAFAVIGAGVSIGFDVLSGRQVDWSEAGKSFALGFIGASSAIVYRTVASGFVGGIASLLDELTDCQPGISGREIFADAINSALTGAIGGSPAKVKGGLPFNRLHQVTDARNNAYLYRKLAQRQFEQDLYDAFFAVGNQGISRAVDLMPLGGGR